MYEYEQFARVISNWGKNCFFQPVSGFGIDHCWRVMCRAVTVFETETAAFPKPTGTNHGFLVPDERFFCIRTTGKIYHCGQTGLDVITMTREHVYQHHLSHR